LHKTFSHSMTLKERLSEDRSSLTSESESEIFLEDLPMRQRGEISLLALDLLILLWAGGVITWEVEVAQDSTRSGHDLLELLILLLISEVILLVVTLVAGVVLIVVVVLVGGVELLPLGPVNDEVSGVAALKVAHRWSPPLLVELVQCSELPHGATSSSGVLLYCSSEPATKEDKVNSKADETVVLVGLASWLPTRALVIKVVLVREASWFGRPFLDSS
jgi:hypothetical protein